MIPLSLILYFFPCLAMFVNRPTRLLPAGARPKTTGPVLLVIMRHIQTVQLMKLSFLLWLTRRRFYKGQHISHIGRTTFHFCRRFISCIASAPAQKQQTSTIFLTQAYSSRRTQHAPGSGALSSQTPRAHAVKSQPLREKFDSPRAGTLKCVQIYACTWYTHAYIFKKKILDFGEK